MIWIKTKLRPSFDHEIKLLGEFGPVSWNPPVICRKIQEIAMEIASINAIDYTDMILSARSIFGEIDYRSRCPESKINYDPCEFSHVSMITHRNNAAEN